MQRVRGVRVRFILITLLACVTALSLGAWWELHQSGQAAVLGIDDANIFFVYAKNFLHEHALVYQPGGEHVEGFTSMLWEMICIAAFGLSTHPELALLGFSILAVAASITYFISVVSNSAMLRSLASPSLIALSAFLWIFSNPSYVVWSTITLMDFAIWSALQIALVALLLDLTEREPTRGKQALFALGLLLLLLARPEGVLIGGVLILLYAYIQYRKTSNIRGSILSAVPHALTFIASLGAIEAFRLWYFGYPLPNTFYAKVSYNAFYDIVHGIEYLIKFFYWYPMGIFSALAMLAVAYVIIRSRRKVELEMQFVIVTAVILATFLIPLVAGGDHFDESRLIMPVWPLFGLPFWYLWVACAGMDAGEFRRLSQSAIAKAWIAAVVLVFLFYMPMYQWYAWPSKGYEIDELWVAADARQQGYSLNSFFAGIQLPTIGVTAAGGVAYAYNGPVVDMLGLNNVAMAHQRNNDREGAIQGNTAFDEETLFKLAPDIILPQSATATTTVAEYVQQLSEVNEALLKNALTDPAFLQVWHPAIMYDPHTKQYLAGYYLVSYLTTLEQHGYIVSSTSVSTADQ